MEKVIETGIPSFSDFVKNMKNEYDEYNNAKIKCGIIGQSGSGKSTLINTILGQDICDTGVTETTQKIGGPYDKNGLSFFDLPGCGTIKFPIEQYIDKMNLKDFDCLVLVTSNRFYENDLYLLKNLSSIGKHVFIVRTKIDQSIDEGKYNKPKKEEYQILSECAYDIEQYLNGISTKGIYLLSSRHPDKWDFGKLILSIENSLRGMKKQKFISEVLSANADIIEKKVKIANKVVMWHSAMAAANGLNPIIGLDISLDIGIILNMNRKIANIFNLDEGAFEFLKNLDGMAKIFLSIKTFTKSIGTREVILIMIKKYTPLIAGKSFLKFIPFVGQAIAASAGFVICKKIGEDTINESKKLALEILNNFTNNV